MIFAPAPVVPVVVAAVVPVVVGVVVASDLIGGRNPGISASAFR